MSTSIKLSESGPPAPGQQITFGGWTYLESGSSLLRWVLTAYDANNNQVGAAAASPNTASPQVWTQELGTFTVPSGAAYVQMYCEIYQPSGTTAARFDDGFLEINGVGVSIAQSLDYLPFGELMSGDSGITTHKFTGDERDSETGLDHTWFRQYSSSLGRWMHPDPAGLAAVDPSNPQSWNRYAYVLNNPLNAIDPFGLDCLFLNATGDGVEENAPELDASGCADQGGYYFAGSIDQNTLVFDPNSDFIFANGLDNNAQFACNGSECGQDAFDAFNNAIGTLSFGGVNGGNSSWLGTFATTFGSNFFSPQFYKQELKQGGCLNAFAHATGDALVPSALPSLSTTTGAGTMAVSAAMRYNAAQGYAASRTNVLGGQGLIFPQKSIPYNSILKGSTGASLAEGGLAYLDGALFQGLLAEAEAAYNGNCH
jgi:RHS repeat-associated protein